MSALSSTDPRLEPPGVPAAPTGRAAKRRHRRLPRVGGRIATTALLIALAVALLAAIPSHHKTSPRREHIMNTLALILKPIAHGWAVTLTDGRELARFRGLGAKRRALRYVTVHDLGREASNVW